MGEYVQEDAYKERNNAIDERCKRDQTDIRELRAGLATLTNLVTEIAALQKQSTEKQCGHEERIRALEAKPGTMWDKVIGALLGAVAGGLGGYLISNLIK